MQRITSSLPDETSCRTAPRLSQSGGHNVHQYENGEIEETFISALGLAFTATGAFAAGHAVTPAVEAAAQSVKNGIVSAEMVVAAENGWMVVQRPDAEMKPGPVVA